MRPAIDSSHRLGKPCGHRRGFWAIGEVLTILIVVAVLMTVVYCGLNAMVGTPLGAAKADVRPIYGISLDDNGKHMWVQRLREDIVRIDCDTGDIKKVLPAQGIDISVMAHNPDGSMVIVCTASGEVHLLRTDEPEQIVNLNKTIYLEAGVADNSAIALGPVSNGRVQGVRWCGAEMREFLFDTTYRSDILKIGLNSSLRRMFVARRDGMVSFHELETGNLDGAALNVGTEGVAFAWSPDECLFGVLATDGEIRVYDVLTGRNLRQRKLDLPVDFVTGVAIIVFSPNGQRLAVSTTHAPKISIWDIETAVMSGQLCGHSAFVHTLQFSTDSDRLYSGSYDGTIREWSVKTCSQLRMID